MSGGNPRDMDPVMVPSFYYVRPVFDDEWRLGLTLNAPGGFGAGNGPNWAGRYYSDELETFYEISLADDALMINHVRHGDFPLTPQGQHVFSAAVWFIGTVEFDIDPDRQTAMSMTNGRVRNLRFDRVD